MPDSYRHTWTSSRGDEYALVIYEAGSTALVAPSVEDLNKDVIKDIMPDWAYERYPYGLHKPTSLSVKFKAARVPATLLSWLIDGVKTLSTTIYTGNDTHTVSIETGPTYDLLIKPVGAAGFTRVWTGVQDATQKVAPSLKDGEIVVNVGDVLQFALKSLDFKTVRDADWDFYTLVHAEPTTVVNRKTSFIDWVWRASSKWWYVAHAVEASEIDNEPGSCYWSVPVNVIAAQWSTYVQAVVRKVVRRDFVVDLDAAYTAAFAELFKQSYGTDTASTTKLAANAQRFPMFITNDNYVGTGTTMNYALHDELGEAYDNFWDYIFDIPKGRYKQWWITYNELSSGNPKITIKQQGPLGPGQYAGSLDITKELRDVDVKLRESVAARVESSTEFAIENDFETSGPIRISAGRNDDGYELPVVHDTNPVMCAYVNATQLAPFGDLDLRIGKKVSGTTPASAGTTYVATNGDRRYMIGKQRMLGVYYVENPNVGGSDAFNGDAGNGAEALIRCHAFQGFANYGESWSTTGTLPESLPSATPVNMLSINAMVQTYQGAVSWLASKFFLSFYGKNSTTIVAKMRMDVGCVFDTVGHDTGLIWAHAFVRRFTVTPATYASYLSPCPTTYYMVGCKCSLLTEIAEITLWAK